MSELKDRLRYVRTKMSEKRLTQTEFGLMLGSDVTRAMIASYEGGTVVPSDLFISQVAAKFGVSAVWLRTGEGSPREPLTEVAQLSAEFHLDDERKAVLEEFCRMKPEAQAYILDFLESVGNRLHVERAAKKKTAAKTQREADAEKQADLKARILLEEEAEEKSSVSSFTDTESATG